jgi:hypothetical protein
MKPSYDCDGALPQFVNGDRVLVKPNGLYATVVRQQQSWDGPEYWFWGNVELLYDDEVKGIANSWQLEKV